MNSQPEHQEKSADALSQTLCRACGLCCDGTLFDVAKISPDDDLDELKRNGITTICEDGSRFALPCKSFDQDCTIYHARRAKICGEYTCKLLRRLVRGVIPLDRAMEIVSHTKAQKQKAQASFLAVFGARTESLRLQYRELLESQEKPESAKRNLAKLHYVALRVQIFRYFRTSKEKLIEHPIAR